LGHLGRERLAELADLLAVVRGKEG